jgi:peroxiredoxin
MRNSIFFKIFILIHLSSVLFGQSQKKYFTLNGVIHGAAYNGYLHLNYNNTRDSCLVINNHFYFKGKAPLAEVGTFVTSKPTGTSQDFYLENEDIKMDISIEKKIINEFEIDWLVVNSISGTKTSLIENDYENYKLKHQKDNDWQEKHYKKLDEIVSKYPKHPYSLSLLIGESWKSSANVQILQELYKKLDLKSFKPEGVLILKKNIYPVESSKVGKAMIDFELPNERGVLINTKQYRGSILLIDFWASWCVPCRKQIPEVTKVYEKFKDKNFKILSISLDKSKDKWLLAVEKEKMQWDNVLEEKEYLSEIVKQYEVNAIPSTFLVDENGVIVANNPTITKLEEYLNENLK